MPTTTIDSRGIRVFLNDDEARAQAAELAARAEQALDIADARGWSLNDADAQRVQLDLDEAARLLTDIGEYKASSVADLSRFYAPGESEQVLGARAAAEERRREQTRRMAEAALMIDELGEDDDFSNSESSEPTSIELDSGDGAITAPERVNMKRSFDSHGLEWWTVSGRGDTKRFADYATAEREARRRVGRA